MILFLTIRCGRAQSRRRGWFIGVRIGEIGIVACDFIWKVGVA